MTVQDLQEVGSAHPPAAPMATTTFMVNSRIATTADLLSCDQGEFHTVTMASADGDARVVFAGTLGDLARTFQAALEALGGASQDPTRTPS